MICISKSKIWILTSINYIVTGSNEGYARFFAKNSSDPLWSFKTGATTGSLAICPDGFYIAVGSNDNNIYLFNKLGLIWKYYAGKSFVSVALSSDGGVITGASSSGDYGKVYTFNKSSNSPLWNLIYLRNFIGLIRKFGLR